MRPTDDLENVIKKKLNFTAGTELHDQMLNDVLDVQEESKKARSAVASPNIGRIIMKSPLTKFAVAAVVIIACLIGLSIWMNTGSGIALADVLAHVEQVKALKYKSTLTMKGLGVDPNGTESILEFIYTTLASGKYGWKEIGKHRPSDGGEGLIFQERYFLPRKKLFVLISRAQKRYLRRELDDAGIEYIRQQTTASNPLIDLKKLMNTSYKSIGRSTIDVIEVEGFRTADPKLAVGRRPENAENLQVDNKIWVDVKTRLPVQYDYLTRCEIVDGTERRNVVHHYVTDDFQWDVPVDASTFEAPPIPGGYAIKDIFPELANEEKAIGGFKQCLELFGNYPEKIDLTFLWAESEKSETIAALRLKEGLKGLTGLERDNQKMDALKPIRFLNKFYIGLAKKDSAYYGKTVTPKDTDKVLMRWKVSDNQYRVIFGDLHAETVSSEKLAELEAVLPK